MNPFSQMQIFFLISSVGFVSLFLLVAIFLFYIIRAVNTFSRIADKLEDGVDEIGDATKEIVEDIRDSFVFKLLFGKKKKNRKNAK